MWTVGISGAGVASNMAAAGAIGLWLRGAALELARAEVAGSSLLAAEGALVDLSPPEGVAVARRAAAVQVAAEVGKAVAVTTDVMAGERARLWL